MMARVSRQPCARVALWFSWEQASLDQCNKRICASTTFPQEGFTGLGIRELRL